MAPDEHRTWEPGAGIRLSGQLLQALQYLRVRRVGHRDTSLENPFLSRGVLKVMAFGMSSQTYAENLAPR